MSYLTALSKCKFFSGEITAEELQQRLEGAKERLASQADMENREGEGRAVGGKQTSFVCLCST